MAGRNKPIRVATTTHANAMEDMPSAVTPCPCGRREGTQRNTWKRVAGLSWLQSLVIVAATEVWDFWSQAGSESQTREWSDVLGSAIQAGTGTRQNVASNISRSSAFGKAWPICFANVKWRAWSSAFPATDAA